MKSKVLFIALCCVVLAPGFTAAGSQTSIAVDDMIVVAASTALVEQQAMVPSGSGDVSLLPEEDATVSEDDLFGLEGGYVHPYISLEGAYTDNLFNIYTDTTSSFITTLSPGIWFASPRKKIIPITITPHNSSPGGLQLEIGDYEEGEDKVLLYGLAGADIKMYSEDSDLDAEDYYLEGLGRYNMPFGLSLQLLDRYSIGHDRFEIGNASADNLKEFDNNLFMATADWDITSKLRARVDYSNFLLDYDEEINAFLEREDNVIDLYGYFKYSVKTSLFLQYRHTIVEYDLATEKDNNQDYFYGGITWDTTDKLSLLFKAGLQDKTYDNDIAGYEDTNELTLDFQMLYRFTEKTEMTLDFYKINEESDSSVAADKDVFGLQFGYRQEFTEKITGKFHFMFESADYAQLVDTERDEDRFIVRPSLQYLFKEWMMGEVAYAFEQRDSTDDLFDYDTNTFYVSLNFGI